MADQEAIQQLADDLSFRIGEMQSEVIGSVLGMVQGKKNFEAIRIINDLNVLNIITLKSQSILSEFQSGLNKLLEKKEMFADITEETLMIFYEVARQEIVGELSVMAGILKKEIINGVLNNKLIDDILESIRKQGYGI